MSAEPHQCHVWIRQPLFGQHVLSFDDFLRFPVELRARLIAEGAVQFFRSSGTCVSLSETLEKIVTTWAAEFDAECICRCRSTKRIRRRTEVTSMDHLSPCDRRRFARTQYDPTGTRVLVGSMAKERFGISEDVSPGGLRFRVRGHYAPGDRLVVTWPDEQGDARETCHEATVVRADRDEGTTRDPLPATGRGRLRLIDAMRLGCRRLEKSHSLSDRDRGLRHPEAHDVLDLGALLDQFWAGQLCELAISTPDDVDASNQVVGQEEQRGVE